MSQSLQGWVADAEAAEAQLQDYTDTLAASDEPVPEVILGVAALAICAHLAALREATLRSGYVAAQV